MAQVILINTIASLMLTGLIWTIQLVHYPSFVFVAKDNFSDFMSFHMKSITYIVAPLMIIELIASICLVFYSYDTLSIINIIYVLLIWLSTFLLSIPCHNQLKKNHDHKVINQLIKTNWPRTILWSLKAGTSIIILYRFDYF